MSNTKEQLMQAIAPDVARINQAMKDDLDIATLGCDPLLMEVLHYGLFNGGKRLRPLLVLLAERLAGSAEKRKSEEELLQLAIAFEYLHGATLYHDDVIDQADLRRGKPSVIKKFGEISAILGGDFLHSRSMYLIGSTVGSKALDIFCQATNAMVDGEFLQLRNARNYNLNESDYFSAVRGKTALLIAATCEIGAMAGSATDEGRNALTVYGLALGTAFQIIDDLLDYQGDQASTGKAVGNDFQEGKMTLPVILALHNAGEKERERLLFLLRNAAVQGKGFEEAYQLIEKNNGFSESRRKAESIVRDALNGLEMFTEEGASQVRRVLTTLAEYVLIREK
jgi:octaprenyl-diphosphate synthase